jgi:hypothetical protein
MIPLFIAVGLLLSIAVNGGNITVDDSNSTIVYFPDGGWKSPDDSLAYNGSHHYADSQAFPADQDATATFAFTGFYFAIG